MVMQIDGEEIKRDPEKDSIDIEEDDSAIEGGEHMMRHMPTKLTFRIEMDEEAQKAGAGTVFNFSARPVHICSGHQLPPASVTSELGRAAILLYLYGTGLIGPHRRQDGGKPTCESDLNLN